MAAKAEVAVIRGPEKDRDVVAPQETDEGIVTEGSTVILTKDRIIQPCRMERGRKVKMDRFSFLVDPIIGHPYGTQFELHKGVLTRVLASTASNDDPEQSLVSSAGSDNRHINDDAGKAQLLTQEEIAELKSAGVSGQVIVDSVIENSSTFKDKTEFSQQKYINKKQKKHVQVVTVLKCSTRLLCDMYCAKGAQKILSMRMDSLARMLTIVNVHAHSRLVVVETTQGLLLSAVLERLGGLGRLIHIFPGDRPVRMALNYSGHIPEESRKILMDFPLNRINQLSCSRQKHSSSQQPSVAMELQSSAAMETLPSVSVPMVTESFSESKSESCDSYAGEKPIPIVSSKTGNNAIGNGDEEQENVLDDSLVGEEGSGSDEGSSQLEDEEDDGTPASKRLKTSTEQISQEERLRRKAARERKFDAAKEELEKGDFDGNQVSPEAIALALLPFLSPSRPFVIFCQFMEPLVQMYGKLKESGMVFDLHLSETWLRKYQVLPSRTHPMNQMSGSCGYILAGMTIEKDQ